MGALMRSMDWSKTPIGPVESWSPALQMLVRLLLANRFQLFLWWGPSFCQIYNDASHPVLGKKHPKSMGQPASECWAEIWHIIGPLIEKPYGGGNPTWMDDIFLEMNRYGFIEETHFTIAYSPVPDSTVPSQIGGVLGTVHEITQKVLGERRVIVLRDLGARSAEAKTAEEACTIAANILSQHAKDVPFALLYLVDAGRKRAHLAGAAGVGLGRTESPLIVELDLDSHREQVWPLAQVFNDEVVRVVESLSERLPSVPQGPWSDAPHSAVVLPIRSNIAHQLVGVLVLGISSRLHFDDNYRVFCEFVCSQVATAIANARAYDEERKRAEALAEVDRAKTLARTQLEQRFQERSAELAHAEENLRTLNHRLIETQEDERKRLARELHDSAGQWLAALKWKISAIQEEIGAQNPALAKKASESVHMLDELTKELRTLSQLLHPPALDEAGLSPALRSYVDGIAERSGLIVELDMDPRMGRLPRDVETAIFRIVQESLTNVHRHAQTKRACVRLAHDSGTVQVEIQDHGQGIAEFVSLDATSAKMGVGLRGMRERVQQLAGEFEFTSGRGGTTVKATLPTKIAGVA